MNRIRKQSAVRKDEIVEVALKQAELLGLKSITRQQVAEGVGVATSLISHHFGTMNQLQRAVIRRAIKQNSIPVVAQAVVLKLSLIHI